MLPDPPFRIPRWGTVRFCQQGLAKDCSGEGQRRSRLPRERHPSVLRQPPPQPRKPGSAPCLSQERRAQQGNSNRTEAPLCLHGNGSTTEAPLCLHLFVCTTEASLCEAHPCLKRQWKHLFVCTAMAYLTCLHGNGNTTDSCLHACLELLRPFAHL